jgi:hypothetical protein
MDFAPIIKQIIDLSKYKKCFYHLLFNKKTINDVFKI